MDQNVICELLHERVREAPDAVAVFERGAHASRARSWSSSSTPSRRASALARRVGIVMDHTVEMIAAVFAVVKRGGAYVSGDLSFPRSGSIFMMRDAGVDAVLANSAHKDKASAAPCIAVDRGMEAEAVSLDSAATPDDPPTSCTRPAPPGRRRASPFATGTFAITSGPSKTSSIRRDRHDAPISALLVRHLRGRGVHHLVVRRRLAMPSARKNKTSAPSWTSSRRTRSPR